MTRLEATVEELKNLSATQLEQAANFIHGLKVAGISDRKQALDRAFGCLTNKQAEEMERAIEQNCERIDASQW